MRRKDREITDAKQIEEILKEGKVCYLALCKENEPYVVPMHYAWQSGYLYLHSAREGKKVEFAKQNPQVSFCIVPQWEIIEDRDHVIGQLIIAALWDRVSWNSSEDVAEKQRPLKPSWDTTLPGHLNFPKPCWIACWFGKLRLTS